MRECTSLLLSKVKVVPTLLEIPHVIAGRLLHYAFARIVGPNLSTIKANDIHMHEGFRLEVSALRSIR